MAREFETPDGLRVTTKRFSVGRGRRPFTETRFEIVPRNRHPVSQSTINEILTQINRSPQKQLWDPPNYTLEPYQAPPISSAHQVSLSDTVSVPHVDIEIIFRNPEAMLTESQSELLQNIRRRDSGQPHSSSARIERLKKSGRKSNKL